MGTKAFVSLSGGIDSSTCLALAVRDYGSQNVTAISIDYGQRHKKEMQQAAAVSNYFGVKHEIHQILGIPKVMLTDANAEVPNISYGEIVGVSPTYVPFRNGQIIAKLAGLAHHRINELNNAAEKASLHDGGMGVWEESDARIYFGAHAEDAAGDAYPDCRLDFIGAMGAAVYIGTYHMVRVKAPLIEMYKNEIVAVGSDLGVPWAWTWSCYKGEELHCGVCPTCRARKDGFAAAGISDPTDYAV